MKQRPVRTCCGCGARDRQDALLRLVLREGELVPDRLRRLRGRGAYLHQRPACWETFAARKGSLRSLRRPVPRATRARLVAGLVAGAPGRETG